MLLSMKNGSTQTNLDLGHEHLGREIWGNTVVHGENHAEERNPHAERSVDRQNPGIPAARESPEKSLMRRPRQFGERGSGVEEDAKRYLHPGPPLYRLTAGGGNSGPGGRIYGPRNFRVK
jgi:hypothetical protein